MQIVYVQDVMNVQKETNSMVLEFRENKALWRRQRRLQHQPDQLAEFSLLISAINNTTMSVS